MSEQRRRIPMRALFSKEWRQLRLVRLVGGVTCAVVPAISLAAAREPSFDLMKGAPIVLFVAWTVLSLFVTVQSFLGDRTVGAELFLLTMPVRRRWVFWSRLAASASSSAAIALTSGAAWLVWALATVPEARSGVWMGHALLLVGLPGGVGILVGVASGAAAAALVSLPLAAVLVGLALGAAPLFLSMLLATLLPFSAGLGGYNVGLLAGQLLFPAFVVMSYGTFCYGEPAGRGRYRRTAIWLSGALALIGVLFVSFART